MKFSKEARSLCIAAASPNRAVYEPAMQTLLAALSEPLREGVMPGDVLSPIFEQEDYGYDRPPEYNTHWLSPGTESDYVAFTLSTHGKFPEFHIESDFLMIPTYEIGAMLDATLRQLKYSQYNLLSSMTEVLMGMMTKKMNDDQAHVLLHAAADRNIVVYDSDAAQGQFSKRLISNGKIVMKRNGGGNASSINQRTLTDVLMSPEGIEDIRNWGVESLDDMTRRDIYLMQDGSINRIFNVNLHPVFELGVDQEYQKYFTDTLGGALAASDEELAIGLDLSKKGSFVMPTRGSVEMFDRPWLREERRFGLRIEREFGLGALDNRFLILLSY